ncbi:MAG TPA: hypothetical protein VE377_00710 [Candidatus Dormibacteraeota bacterium]|nr:hypothetical protein [Candidatus Dormibacteraeota bacterium]
MSPQPPPNALRLTFAYDGDTIRFVGQQPLTATLPPSHPVAEYHGRAGHWFELLDASGKILYGRRLHDPMPTHREVFSKGAPPVHAEIANRKGTFDVLVPILPAGASVVVFGLSAPAGTGPKRLAAGKTAARELIRFDMKGGSR